MKTWLWVVIYPMFYSLGLSFVIRKDLLWSKAWNWKWAQIWQIYPRSASRCTPHYWHLVAKLGRSTLDLPADVPPILTSSGQIWQIYPRSAGRCTPQLTSSGQEWQFQVSIVTAHISRSTGRSTPTTPSTHTNKCIMGYILWDVFGSHFGFFKKRWEFSFISE